MAKYQPEPIDTSHIALPKSILSLEERLAENVHEVWAAQRAKDGWTYGGTRDDEGKRHPCLVPYGELPESEKRYDRNTMEETLKCILALGYSLDSSGYCAEEDDHALRKLNLLLEGPGKPDSLQMLRLWRDRNPNTRPETTHLYEIFASRLIKMEELVVAYDVVVQGLSIWPKDRSLLHKKGLILARSGATEEALSIAVGLERVTGKQDPLRDEVLGLLARCHKDLWEQDFDQAKKAAHLARAFHYYILAYSSRRGTYYTGINAAHIALLKGDPSEADRLAGKVLRECERECDLERKTGAASYWLNATRGHAHLIKSFHAPESMDDAERWLSLAAKTGAGNYGDLNSTKRSIRQIRANVNLPPGFGKRVDGLIELFQCPRVVVFSGHMIDRPGRLSPRFPQSIVEQVKREIKHRLKDMNAGVGFASGACGADLLFHEAMRELGGETHLVLPFAEDEFVKESVAIGEHAEYWRRKFRTVMKSAKSVVTVSRQKTSFGSVYYDYANLVLNGLSKNQAAHLDTELSAFAVWNGQSGDGPGGTASMHGYWKDVMAIPDIRIIDPRDFMAAESADPLADTVATSVAVSSAVSSSTSLVPDESIKAMLFADVVKFSKLRADQIPDFVKNFLGAIGKLIESTEHKPETKNTWGDGLFFVFDTVEDAGSFALELRDLVMSRNWAEKGLDEETSIRIALHAGPVLRCEDPILKAINYTGYHVNMAARLEPITPPGQVYATEQFAALASFRGAVGFACDYAGQIPFPKGFGAYPIYHVRIEK